VAKSKLPQGEYKVSVPVRGEDKRVVLYVVKDLKEVKTDTTNKDVKQ
jgi:hypothetical protein